MSHKRTAPSSSAAQAYADVPVLIHVGPHKTGTTWLQRNLWANAEGVIYNADVTPSHQAFLHPGIEDFSIDAALETFRPMLDRARAAGKPFVISDEALGGRPFGQRFLREITAERLSRTFPHAHILITTREQDSILLSMYGEYLRYGHSSSLQAFLCQDTGNPNLRPLLDLSYYEWDRFVRVFENFFPPEQVLAVPMEWGLKETGNYPSALAAFLGAPLDVPANVTKRSAERAAWSGWALDVLRHANKLHPQDSRYLSKRGRFSPHSLAYQVDRMTPDFARERRKKAMRKTVRDSIGNRFAQSNRRFQDMTEFSLADLSYRVAPASDGNSADRP